MGFSLSFISLKVRRHDKEAVVLLGWNENFQRNESCFNILILTEHRRAGISVQGSVLLKDVASQIVLDMLQEEN
jgi:hypothetical protein